MHVLGGNGQAALLRLSPYMPVVARKHQAGFSLVELMVVLCIIGLAGVAVVMTAPTQDVLGRQADQLAEGLAHARDEAILGARAIEVTVTSQGYGFTRQHFGDWRPLQHKPFGNVMWSDGVRPGLPRRGGQITFRFDPAGAASPQSVALSRHGATASIHVDAAGTVRIDARTR